MANLTKAALPWRYRSQYCLLARSCRLNMPSAAVLRRFLDVKPSFSLNESNYEKRVFKKIFTMSTGIETCDFSSGGRCYEWVPFKVSSPLDFNSENLRYCEQCMRKGDHFAFNQILYIDNCPFHNAPLKSHCPECNKSFGLSLKNICDNPFGCQCGMRWIDTNYLLESSTGADEELSVQEWAFDYLTHCDRLREEYTAVLSCAESVIQSFFQDASVKILSKVALKILEDSPLKNSKYDLFSPNESGWTILSDAELSRIKLPKAYPDSSFLSKPFASYRLTDHFTQIKDNAKSDLISSISKQGAKKQSVFLSEGIMILNSSQWSLRVGKPPSLFSDYVYALVKSEDTVPFSHTMYNRTEGEFVTCGDSRYFRTLKSRSKRALLDREWLLFCRLHALGSAARMLCRREADFAWTTGVNQSAILDMFRTVRCIGEDLVRLTRTGPDGASQRWLFLRDFESSTRALTDVFEFCWQRQNRVFTLL